MVDNRIIFNKKVQELLDLGFSLVPSNIKNKDGKPKVPWWDWKRLTKSLSAVELLDAMTDSCADSVAVLAGKLSGDLFLIDIDTKYKNGVDAEIFRDIREMYPSLWEKIRIEKTPSGGYHILYRIDLGNNEFPGFSGAIANRPATEFELIAKPKTGWYGFIETKNIFQVYPSPGYTVVKDGICREFELGGLSEIGELNVLSWEEHSSIFSLCSDFDEKIDEKNLYVKPSREENDFYDENPFVDFNNGKEKDSVFELCGGWIFKKISGGKKYYKREDAKTNGDDAIYNIGKNFYKIYTTSSGLDSVGYSPINLLIQLKFGGDKKSCYSWLVASGYGKIKPSREKWIIKKAIERNQEVEDLPKNISEEAKLDFDVQRERIKDDYPYGIFWQLNDKDNWVINREKFYHAAAELGFSIRNQEIHYVNGYMVETVNENFFFNSLKRYMGDCDEEAKNSYEHFIQHNGKFSISRLGEFDNSLLLDSNKEVSFKFFKNCYVEVTKDSLLVKGYETLDKLVLKDQIQNRKFINLEVEEGQEYPEIVKKTLYYRFLEKAFIPSGEGLLPLHLLRCIGYYAHDYKSPMTPYIVVLCEMCDDSKRGGGSGKNLFTNLFNLTTTVLDKPAKNVKFDDTLLRTRKGEKILSLNDVEKKFDYLGLRELSSGKGEVGKKFMQEQTISNKDMPKFIVNTNFSFDPSLPGLKRRLVPLEFTEFFSIHGGVDIFFGKSFPFDRSEEHDWTEADFLGYDFIILKSIQAFLRTKCRLPQQELSDGGWIKQFEQRFFKPTFLFIESNIEEWCRLEKIRIIDQFNVQLNDFYNENNIDKNWRLSSIRINEALKEYCDHFGIEFTPSKNLGRMPDGRQLNGKVFVRIGNTDIKPRIIYTDYPDPEEEKKPDDLPF